MRTVALCVMGLSLMALVVRRNVASGDDFRAFYGAAQLIQSHRNVFTDESSVSQKRTGRDARGQRTEEDPFSRVARPDRARVPQENGGSYVPYNRFPSYALALSPLASLPYRSARFLWFGVMTLAFAGCVRMLQARLLSEKKGAPAAGLAFSFPAAVALALGQDIALVLLICLAAGRVFARGGELTAGLIASLAAIKPTYIPAVGLVFLAKSRRGALGFTLGVAIQAALSFAVQGLDWPVRYLALLRTSFFALDPRRMPNLRALAAGLSLPDGAWIAGGVVLLAVLFAASRRLSFSDALMLALPAGMMASPHCMIYDAVAIVPLAVSVLSMDSWSGRISGAALTPIPWLLMMSENPEIGPLGGLIVVVSTICAGVRFYKMRAPAGTGFTAALRIRDLIGRRPAGMAAGTHPDTQTSA